jgi:hypothetical protein
MTCRGSRFADGAKRNPDGQVFMKNRETNEWLNQNHKSTRNFIRKWGHMVKHNSFMKPIIPPKYDIGLVVNNCSYELLYELEPWCSTIYTDAWGWKQYVEDEQKNTLIDLKDRVKSSMDNEPDNDIILEFDAKKVTPVRVNYNIWILPKQFNPIGQLSEILANDEELEEGEFDLGIFKIKINKIETYEKENIHNS